MDDVTLGKLLTEAQRGQADHCEPEGMSVSQSSSVVFDGSGQPDGERNVDETVRLRATRSTCSAHSKFSENTQTEKMVDGSGQPDERNSSNAQIRSLLEEQRLMVIAEYREKSRSSRTPCSSRRRRAPTPTRTTMATEIGTS